MHTIPDSKKAGIGRRIRRNHSAEFKAQVVAACCAPGVSLSAVAMAHGINANLARRWVRLAERGGPMADRAITPAPTFVPLQLTSSVQAAPASADIHIQLHRGPMTISVNWPSTAAAECAAWLRELLR